MPGRRRTNWPRITGKRSQAGALIRTRPTIATERGTGPAQDQNPAASSTALRANAATGIPAHPAFADGASRGGTQGPGQTVRATKMMQIAFSDPAKDDAVTRSLRMHPEQSPADLGLMRHAPPPARRGCEYGHRNLRALGHRVGQWTLNCPTRRNPGTTTASPSHHQAGTPATGPTPGSGNRSPKWLRNGRPNADRRHSQSDRMCRPVS